MKPDSRVSVKNAADPEQVKRAKEIDENSQDKELIDLKHVLDTPQGRRVLWRVLEQCKVFGSIFEPSSRIYYLSGKQDVGHYLMAKIAQADESALVTMMKEAKIREVNNV